MLEYCKTILSRVHFNKSLFMKEYRKAKSWLTADEQAKLRNWLKQNNYLSKPNFN